MTTNRIWLTTFGLGIIWFIVRIIAGSVNNFSYWSSQPVGVLTNLLLLLGAIFLALYLTYNQGPQIRTYWDDLKLSAKTALAYTLVISLCMGIYYATFNELDKEKERSKQELTEFLNNDNNLKSIRQENSNFSNKTKEEIYQEKLGTINEKTSIRNLLTFGGMAIFLAGLVYSIVVPWIFRTLLLKESNE
jgi:hypothetical protein